MTLIQLSTELESLAHLTKSAPQYFSVDFARWNSPAAHHAQSLLEKEYSQFQQCSSQLSLVAAQLREVPHDI
ncbi:MAG: hypothetical protein QM632_02710 [Micrococcaceae bacterium]